MHRADYTRLAEWVGREEAKMISSFGTARKGGFAIGSLIESLADELSETANFKADKFTRHATVEREFALEAYEEERRA